MIKNNIIGIDNVLKLSQLVKTRNFIFVSTDKAVRPKNIMGLTKKIGEILTTFYANKEKGKYNYNSVRFGNVIGSSGSFLQIFKKQFNNGGPITLTSKKATRYFMSIPEAVSLILCSANLKIKTDVFYFDMGNPIKIYDLANKIANLLGKKLVKKSKRNDEVEYKIIGLRKGEKLHEELLIPKNSKLKNTKIKNILYLSDNQKHIYEKLLDFKKLKQLIINKDKVSLSNYLLELSKT